MKSPTSDALTTYQLAGLAALEAAIVFAARALVHSYPGLNKVERPSETAETATARDLIDQCEYMLAALDAHWRIVAAHLPETHLDKSILF